MVRLQLQLHVKVHLHNTVARHAGTAARGRLRFSKSSYESSGLRLLDGLTRIAAAYPVVIINWVQYLGPPGPFSFPDSRDLLEVLQRTVLAERESPKGGSPRVREDPLGTPLSLSAKKVLREPRGGPENLGRRRVLEVRDTEPS